MWYFFATYLILYLFNFIIDNANYSTKVPNENTKVSLNETKVSFFATNVVLLIAEYYNKNRNIAKKRGIREILAGIDSEYLKYKIRSNKIKQSEFSEILGISRAAFYKKMRGDTEWTCDEMKRMRKILNLNLEEFNKIFGF